MSSILLDTHVALWGAEGTLAPRVSAIVSDAALRGALLISPISAWEIGVLVRKKRFRSPVPVTDFVRMLFAQDGIVTATLTPHIAVSSNALPGEFHADPADRILVATAAAYGAQLVTHDKAILNYAKRTKYIQCIAC